MVSHSGGGEVPNFWQHGSRKIKHEDKLPHPAKHVRSAFSSQFGNQQNVNVTTLVSTTNKQNIRAKFFSNT